MIPNRPPYAELSSACAGVSKRTHNVLRTGILEITTNERTISLPNTSPVRRIPTVLSDQSNYKRSKMIQVPATRYSLPGGRRTEEALELIDSYKPYVRAVFECGLTVCLETLRTDEAVVYLVDPEFGDYKISFTDIGMEASACARLMRAFDAEDFRAWRKKCIEVEESTTDPRDADNDQALNEMREDELF